MSTHPGIFFQGPGKLLKKHLFSLYPWIFVEYNSVFREKKNLQINSVSHLWIFLKV